MSAGIEIHFENRSVEQTELQRSRFRQRGRFICEPPQVRHGLAEFGMRSQEVVNSMGSHFPTVTIDANHHGVETHQLETRSIARTKFFRLLRTPFVVRSPVLAATSASPKPILPIICTLITSSRGLPDNSSRRRIARVTTPRLKMRFEFQEMLLEALIAQPRNDYGYEHAGGGLNEDCQGV